MTACFLLPGHFSTAGAQQPACDASAGLAVLNETVNDQVTQIPLRNATLTATWRDGNRDVQTHVVTDSLGKASICAPADRLLRLRASYMDINSSIATAVLSLARATSHTMPMDVPNSYVRGVVLDDATGNPVGSVSVRLAGTSESVLSDEQGRFVFARVPMGDYTLRIEHISYASATMNIEVRHEDLDASIRLAVAAIPLQPITVKAFSRRLERAGYYERQKRGMGTFIGRKQLDAPNVQTSTDVLRSVPSMQVITSEPRRNAPRTTTRGRGNCRYRFIVDGTRTMPDFELDNIPPYAIEGIEIYNGLAEVPAVFRAVATPENPATATCGVIVVWTRDSR